MGDSYYCFADEWQQKKCCQFNFYAEPIPEGDAYYCFADA